MPWRCPVCEIQIQHSSLEVEPRLGVMYRCHACRLELEFNPQIGKFAVAPFDADPSVTPVRGLPSPLTRKPPRKPR